MRRITSTARRTGGFTIIELLVVVIVIGILASAGIAKYQNFSDMARRRVCTMNQNSIETGIGVWCTQNVDFQDNAEGFARFYNTSSGYYHNPGWGTGGPFQSTYAIMNVVRDQKMFRCPSHLKYYNDQPMNGCDWCGYGCNGGTNSYSNYCHYWGGPGYSSWNGSGGHWYDPAGGNSRHSLVWCSFNGGYACNGPDNTGTSRHSIKW